MPLGFDSCFTAFLVICAGGILGFILFFIEMISRTKQDVKNNICHTCGQYVEFQELELKYIPI